MTRVGPPITSAESLGARPLAHPGHAVFDRHPRPVPQHFLRLRDRIGARTVEQAHGSAYRGVSRCDAGAVDRGASLAPRGRVQKLGHRLPPRVRRHTVVTWNKVANSAEAVLTSATRQSRLRPTFGACACACATLRVR